MKISDTLRRQAAMPSPVLKACEKNADIIYGHAGVIATTFAVPRLVDRNSIKMVFKRLEDIVRYSHELEKDLAKLLKEVETTG
jgi:hypothetical protein